MRPASTVMRRDQNEHQGNVAYGSRSEPMGGTSFTITGRKGGYPPEMQPYPKSPGMRRVPPMGPYGPNSYPQDVYVDHRSDSQGYLIRRPNPDEQGTPYFPLHPPDRNVKEEGQRNARYQYEHQYQRPLMTGGGGRPVNMATRPNPNAPRIKFRPSRSPDQEVARAADNTSSREAAAALEREPASSGESNDRSETADRMSSSGAAAEEENQPPEEEKMTPPAKKPKIKDSGAASDNALPANTESADQIAGGGNHPPEEEKMSPPEKKLKKKESGAAYDHALLLAQVSAIANKECEDRKEPKSTPSQKSAETVDRTPKRIVNFQDERQIQQERSNSPETPSEPIPPPTSARASASHVTPVNSSLGTPADSRPGLQHRRLHFSGSGYGARQITPTESTPDPYFDGYRNRRPIPHLGSGRRYPQEGVFPRSIELPPHRDDGGRVPPSSAPYRQRHHKYSEDIRHYPHEPDSPSAPPNLRGHERGQPPSHYHPPRQEIYEPPRGDYPRSRYDRRGPPPGPPQYRQPLPPPPDVYPDGPDPHPEDRPYGARGEVYPQRPRNPDFRPNPRVRRLAEDATPKYHDDGYYPEEGYDEPPRSQSSPPRRQHPPTSSSSAVPVPQFTDHYESPARKRMAARTVAAEVQRMSSGPVSPSPPRGRPHDYPPDYYYPGERERWTPSGRPVREDKEWRGMEEVELLDRKRSREPGPLYPPTSVSPREGGVGYPDPRYSDYRYHRRMQRGPPPTERPYADQTQSRYPYSPGSYNEYGPEEPPPHYHTPRNPQIAPGLQFPASNPYAYPIDNIPKHLEQPRLGVGVGAPSEEPRQKTIILRRKFSWKHYPELEAFLIANREEYLRHSALNYTIQQKQYNNRLTERLLELAARHNYVFDEEVFSFVAVRDRIRCYYKSYVQSAKKRGVLIGYGSKKKLGLLPPREGGNAETEGNDEGTEDAMSSDPTGEGVDDDARSV